MQMCRFPFPLGFCVAVLFLLAVFQLAALLLLPAAACSEEEKPQAKVLARPQDSNSTAAPLLNGVQPEKGQQDPEAAEIEDRIMRYKFILESLGFSMEELILSPDFDYQVELVFEGRLSTTEEKLNELSLKFENEEKLMGMLRTVYDYSNRDLTNYGAYKVVLRLSKPVDIVVHYRKF